MIEKGSQGSLQVMGILNLTVDSFYDGGRYISPEQIMRQVDKMLLDGIDILDLGACSTRPGSHPPSIKEETKILHKALELITQKHPNLPISIDTYRSQVADSLCTHFNIAYINDISGGSLDTNMYEVVAKHQTAYIMMHTKGTPATMQTMTQYTDIIQEMMVFFSSGINKLRNMGVNNIIIDPGFGFAKDLNQNYFLLRNLNLFKLLETPILVGLSRKSMIQKVLNKTAQDCLNGTTCLHTLALAQGANILRVHDVKEAKETTTLFSNYITSSN